MRFIRVQVDGTVEVIDKDNGDRPKYFFITDHLHPDYVDYEHPTNIRNDIWMVNDDAYEYVKDDEWDKYTNNFACKIDKHGRHCIGEFIIFKIGPHFLDGNEDEIVNDILDFTDKEIENIKNIFKN